MNNLVNPADFSGQITLISLMQARRFIWPDSFDPSGSQQRLYMHYGAATLLLWRR